MKIPRKITPDNIKDSVVQFVFNPACPPELVIGRFENHLKDLLEFKGGTPPSKQIFRYLMGMSLISDNFKQVYFKVVSFLISKSLSKLPLAQIHWSLTRLKIIQVGK